MTKPEWFATIVILLASVFMIWMIALDWIKWTGG